MKKIALLRAVIICSILCNNYYVSAQCTARSIIKDCRSNIKPPYKYSGCWMSEFVFDTKSKIVEGHFTAFEGEKYQIIFCSSPFEESVIINVYDNSIRNKKGRTKLFDGTRSMNKGFWQFEPPVSGDYFIEYRIPPSKTGKSKTGCVMFLFGTIIETTDAKAVKK